MQEKLENWVAFPRKIASDYRDRKITRDEYFVYSWLRLNANSFGISTTSLSDLSNDLFRKKNKENYANKTLLSLKEKRYIYYPKRTGCRGSFLVHLGDFILPNKKISSLDKFFITDEIRTSDNDVDIQESEPEQSFEYRSQNLKQINQDIKSVVYNFSVDRPLRTDNNDKDNNNIKSIPISKETNLSDFEPRTLDERLCLDIATKLGEKSIGFMLSSLKKYGREILEKAWRTFQEEETKTTINNRGAYFNNLVKRIDNEF